MAIVWNCEATNLIVYNVSGKLGLAELQQAQQESSATIDRAKNWNVLVLLQDFEGWEQDKGWGKSATVAEQFDEIIGKMAIVGPPEWRDKAEMFTLKGMRPVEIEYFTSEAQAREWL